MPGLNFLPWREQQRQQRQQRFVRTVSGAVVLTLIVVVLQAMVLMQRHSNLLNALVDSQAGLTHWTEISQTLLRQLETHEHRHRCYAELMELRPGTSWLTLGLQSVEEQQLGGLTVSQLNFAEGRLRLQGSSQDGASVASLMTQLANALPAADIRITHMAQQQGERAYRFTADAVDRSVVRDVEHISVLQEAP